MIDENKFIKMFESEYLNYYVMREIMIVNINKWSDKVGGYCRG